MGEVIQLQGDQRKDVQEFLVDKKEGLALDAKTIKVCLQSSRVCCFASYLPVGNRSTASDPYCRMPPKTMAWTDRSFLDKFTCYALAVSVTAV